MVIFFIWFTQETIQRINQVVEMSRPETLDLNDCYGQGLAEEQGS